MMKMLAKGLQKFDDMIGGRLLRKFKAQPESDVVAPVVVEKAPEKPVEPPQALAPVTAKPVPRTYVKLTVKVPALPVDGAPPTRVDDFWFAKLVFRKTLQDSVDELEPHNAASLNAVPIFVHRGYGVRASRLTMSPTSKTLPKSFWLVFPDVKKGRPWRDGVTQFYGVRSGAGMEYNCGLWYYSTVSNKKMWKHFIAVIDPDRNIRLRYKSGGDVVDEDDNLKKWFVFSLTTQQGVARMWRETITHPDGYKATYAVRIEDWKEFRRGRKCDYGRRSANGGKGRLPHFQAEHQKQSERILPTQLRGAEMLKFTYKNHDFVFSVPDDPTEAMKYAEQENARAEKEKLRKPKA